MKKTIAVLTLFITLLAAAGALAEACSGYSLIPQGSTAEFIQEKLNAGGNYCLDYHDLDSASFTVPAGKVVELCLHDSLHCDLITIEANAELTLKNTKTAFLRGRIVNQGTLNIDFDGSGQIEINGDAPTANVTYVLQNDNTVVMKNGVIDAPVLNNGSFTMQGGSFHRNVVNTSGAVFEMEDGSIRSGGSSNGFVENKEGAAFIMKGESAEANFSFGEYDFQNGQLTIYAGTIYSADGKLPEYDKSLYENHAYIKVLGTIDFFDSDTLVVKPGTPGNTGGNNGGNTGGNNGGNTGNNGNNNQGGNPIDPGKTDEVMVPGAVPSVPKTGDSSMLVLWMALMLLSIAGMWVLRRRVYR